MGKTGAIILCVTVLVLFNLNLCFAVSGGDLGLSEANIKFSSDRMLEGSSYRIYCTVINNSEKDLLGNVKFFDETAGRQIGSDQTVSIFAGRTDDIFVDWKPGFEGAHVISIKIEPWVREGDNLENNAVTKTVVIIKDTDHDKISDLDDPDDDNDGVTDEEDHFPEDASEWMDTDGDTKGDNTDIDDDNDGIPDTDDKFPLDSLESKDTDGDGEGDTKDNDDDNDLLDDSIEIELATDPLNPDTDTDKVKDGEDGFPKDPKEQYDYDKDGLGDNIDADDDNDEIADETDPNDHNKAPTIIIEGNEIFGFLNRDIVLDASNSYDEEGQITETRWSVNGNEQTVGENLIYTFNSQGIQKIKILVFDDKGEPREKSLEITIYDLDFYLTAGLFGIIFILAFMIFFEYISKALKKA
jgi:hypothetical protein